uniref:DUF5672 domain-containing protein n=1 Tax=viral metagenome TaxID=1070528 RepID=A0A6C0LYT2_9ZZZZ
MIKFTEIYKSKKEKEKIKEKRKNIVNENHLRWIKYCNNNIYRFPNNILPKLSKKSENNAVLIEFRPMIHLEYIIRRFIYYLGKEWMYTIVCGKDNYDTITNIVNKLSNNITIVNLNISVKCVNEYNKVLLTPSFWERLDGKKILIHQEDSIIFKHFDNKYLKYDYIGAPWNKKFFQITKNNVGNGGLSLRSKDLMIYILNNYDYNKEKYDSFTQSRLKNRSIPLVPEDVFFVTMIEKYNIGKIAHFDIAKKFCIEWIYDKDTLCGHQWWKSKGNHSVFNFENCELLNMNNI